MQRFSFNLNCKNFGRFFRNIFGDELSAASGSTGFPGGGTSLCRATQRVSASENAFVGLHKQVSVSKNAFVGLHGRFSVSENGFVGLHWHFSVSENGFVGLHTFFSLTFAGKKNERKADERTNAP